MLGEDACEASGEGTYVPYLQYVMAESCTGTKCEEIEVYDVPYFGVTLESLRSLVFIILQPETTHLS